MCCKRNRGRTPQHRFNIAKDPGIRITIPTKHIHCDFPTTVTLQATSITSQALTPSYVPTALLGGGCPTVRAFRVYQENRFHPQKLLNTGASNTDRPTPYHIQRDSVAPQGITSHHWQRLCLSTNILERKQDRL